jgi:hypothetical protein
LAILNNPTFRKLSTLITACFLLVNSFWLALPIVSVLGSPGFIQKWHVKPELTSTNIMPLAADLVGDEKLEIIISGGNTTKGAITVLNGTTGEIMWQTIDSEVTSPRAGISMHSPFEIADLNNDGDLEIIVGSIYPLVLNGTDGSVIWFNDDVMAYENYSPVWDIDDDGYKEVFVSSGRGPYNGIDYITSFTYNGYIMNQAYSWHPCWGGMTIGDTNFDGRYELYQGDRSETTGTDEYRGGGMGLRALDAHTLEPLWNDPEILCSSQAPILADVDKDGILDVISSMQSSDGIVVLNSADGSVVTTGGIYRKGSIYDHHSHSNPTVYDIDGDGNLEFIDCRNSPVRVYDLYDWTLDATLRLPSGQYLESDEPPKLGDVTGDGKMDIIAVTDGDYVNDVYIYNKTFEIVDQITGLRAVNSFTLVQDVDDNGLNELILTSEWGDVYCFETAGVSPAEGIDSHKQFYSIYKQGAADYVSAPVPSRPFLSEELPLDNSLNSTPNPTLSIRAENLVGNLMNVVFSTNASGTGWEEVSSEFNVKDGVYEAIPTNMDNLGTTYFWSVNATDTVTGNWTYRTYSFVLISDEPPTHDNPSLVSSNALNGTKENLICTNQTTLDPDGNSVTNIYNWIVNDIPIANLLMPFDTQQDTGTVQIEVFSDGFEYSFDSWDENGVTNWNRTTDQPHLGSYSARASSDDTYLTSDNIDMSNVEAFIVSFWYMYNGSDDDPIYLQFWDGDSYHTIFDLGKTTKNEWHKYSLWWRTVHFFGCSDFRIRFQANSIDSGEYLWLDDVSVMHAPARAKDYSGYGNNGTVTGATWTSQGAVGGAYLFDGNDRIMIEDNGSTLGGDGSWAEISVEFWVKATQITSTEPLIWKYDDNSGYRVEFRKYSDRVYIRWRVYREDLDDYQRESLTYNIYDNPSDWHHVVCTYKSSGSQKIFVDGIEVASRSVGYGNIRSTVGVPLDIGYADGSDFVGFLDEVRIYPSVLHQSQVYNRYNETVDGLSNNSTMFWQETTVGDTWRCEVTPNDGFGDGETLSSQGLLVLESVNTPAVAANISLTPELPVTTDDLVGSYDYYDADGDPEWGTEIYWYKDGVLQPSLNNSLTVDSSFTTKGEVWNFTVTPHDGAEFGTTATSTVTIQNSPPEFDAVHVGPDPAFETDNLTAFTYGWLDADGDTESYDYQWQILVGDTWDDLDGETTSTLDSTNFASGDYVRVIATAFDGTDLGEVHIKEKWIDDFTSLADPLLVSGLGTNTTEEDLTCYNQTSATATSNIYSWYVDDVPYANLIMPFDTNSPSTATDYSGYSNNGAVTGATWSSDGIQGGAYNFEGNGDVIVVGDSESLGNDGSWTELTVEYWVNPSTDQNGARVVNKNGGDSDDSGKYMAGFNTNGPANVVFFGAIIDGSYEETYDEIDTVIPSGIWSHIVGTYRSGEGFKIYINGTLKSQNLGESGAIDASVGEPLFIGYSAADPGDSNRYLYGLLDEVRIYNRTLSAEQVMQRYVESKDDLIESSTIVSEETDVGDVWKCEVTPNNGTGDGTTLTSNTLTVQSVGGSTVLTVQGGVSWHWSDTNINSVVEADVDDDGAVEIVTAGYYYDGTRDVAQLVVWNGTTFEVENIAVWYWDSNTRINSVAVGDVDGDGAVEIVTGGYYYDGTRDVAQLVVWDGSTLAVDTLTSWYWTGNTRVNSVAVGDVDGDGADEIVTGGYYTEGVKMAQLVVWNGTSMAVENLASWYWTADTEINAVSIGNVDADDAVEIVTGGYYYDGTRDVAQLVVWDGSTLTAENLNTWYWAVDTMVNSIAIGNVDGDGVNEIITAGYYNDGSRDVAQLVVWDGSTLTAENLNTWYWTGDTRINSVAVGDVDADGVNEIITAGYHNDLARNVAQLVIWNGTTFEVENVASWYWTADTEINAVSIGNVDADDAVEIVTGGYYYDGASLNAQIVVWSITPS